MTFRFFKSVLSALFLASAVAGAQTTPVPATPAPKKKPKEGYIRFWNMMPKSEGELILVKNDATPEGEAVLYAGPLNYHAGYLGLPPARYALKVVRRADPKTPLESFDVVLRADVYVSFLARLVEGKVKVEMIDDTFDAEKAVAGKLTIRQLYPDAQVVVTSNARLSSRPLVQGETEALDGFPLQVVTFEMKATGPKGPVQIWTADVDFKLSRHASLLVVPDGYGRFRPRVSMDGMVPRSSGAEN